MGHQLEFGVGFMVWRKSAAWLEGLALLVLFWWREEWERVYM
jgi:hypothetical protein